MLFGRRRSVSRGQASRWRRQASRGVRSIVWLSLVRKRSACPLSRRSLGRMRTPVCTLTGYGITPERVDQFAGKGISNRLELANMNTCREPKRMSEQRLANSSRTTAGAADALAHASFKLLGDALQLVVLCPRQKLTRRNGLL